MIINILGQGFEEKSKNSIGKKLIKLFSKKEYHTFIGFSAFMSLAGINGLSKYIKIAKRHLKLISIIVGVDQKGTSKEALEALLKLNINSYVFYQPSHAIFHPKIYLFEGNNKSELIIGSTNLTSQGLFSNIETSIHLIIENNNDSEKQIINELKNYFKSIFEFSDPNIEILSQELIEDLVKVKIIPTESERKAIQEKIRIYHNSETKSIITNIFPRRKIPKIPKEFKGITAINERHEINKEDKKDKTNDFGRLVWIRKKLPSSSVQGSASGTHPTGGLRLVQDKFMINNDVIDQTKYFRNDIFGKFKWKEIKKVPFVEVANVPFEIIILGNNIGKYKLQVRHKPSGEAGQHNYTTSISWGDISNKIKRHRITGRRLELYAPQKKSNVFYIIIK